MVSDLSDGSLLEVIDSHKSSEIINVLKQQPESMRANVQEVCVDMWGGFKKVIREVFPNALIMIDRFHVMKLVNSSLNQLRLQLELKGLKNRCLLLKNHQNLTEEEKAELKTLLNCSPCLSIAYELKEELREIYESSTTVKMGQRKLTKWLTSARIIFGKTAQTLENHLTDICHYFINRTTSGVMEGLNNRIQLILRQSYGFKSFEMMRSKLLDGRWSGSYGKGTKGEYREQTTDVGHFPPNDFGLHDMHGNVWEWCEDHYHSSYQGRLMDGSAWIDEDRTNTGRVLRGGSWYGIPLYCRSAYRYVNIPRGLIYYNVGFRIVCVMPLT